MLSGSNQSNVGSIIVILKGFEVRKEASLSADAILQNLREKLNQIPEALVFAFGPPPIQGVGSTGGFRMMVQDRRGGEYQQLQAISQNLIEAGNQQPGLVGLFSSFRADTPEVFIDVDRTKAKSKNVPLSNVFDALQIYLGSAYVNDFTFLGRSFQVNAQADSRFRVTASDILKLKTRSIDGKMVPLSTLASIQETFGPGVVNRYNLYTAADLSGDTKPGYSSGHAINVMEELCRRLLPPGFGFEWTT